MDGKCISIRTFQNSLEGIGYIRFASSWYIISIHIATQFKGTSRIGLHGFYKFVEIVVDITFMCFGFCNIVDIVLTKLAVRSPLDKIRSFGCYFIEGRAIYRHFFYFINGQFCDLIIMGGDL